MSLESAVQENTAAMRELAQVLREALGAELHAMVAAAAAKPKTAPPPPPATPSGDAPDYAATAAAVQAACKAHGTKRVVDILHANFGVKNIKAAEEGQYADIIAAVQGLGDE